jgi:hypothetical protein
MPNPHAAPALLRAVPQKQDDDDDHVAQAFMRSVNYLDRYALAALRRRSEKRRLLTLLRDRINACIDTVDARD